MTAPDFTPEKVKEYLENSGACPYCGVEGDQMETSTDFDSTSLFRRWVCQSCGKKWVETYTLTNVHPLE